MKKVNIFLLLLLVRVLPAQKIWEAQNLNLPEPQNQLYLDVVNDQVAWMAVQDGDFTTCPWTFEFSENTFSRTTDGQAWTSGTYPNSGVGVLTSLQALDANLAWITFADFVESNKVLKTTDGGLNWTAQNLNISVFVDFVHFFDNANGVVVGDPDSLGFEVFTTGLGGGNSWFRVNPANPTLLPATLPGEFSVPYHASEGNHLWFVTNFSRVFHTFSKGITWEVWNGPVQALPDVIACHNNACLLAFNSCDSLSGAQQFHLFRTTDKGQIWQNITPADSLFAVGQLRYIPGTGVLIGSFRGSNLSGPYQTRISYNDGTSWEIIDTGTPVFDFDFQNGSVGYATHYQTGTEPSVIYKYTGPKITSGLTEQKPLDAEVSLSPNPTGGLLRVSVQGQLQGEYRLSVSDALGRVVHVAHIDQAGSFEETVDLSPYPAGLYFVTLCHATGRFCGKVAKR